MTWQPERPALAWPGVHRDEGPAEDRRLNKIDVPRPATSPTVSPLEARGLAVYEVSAATT